MKCREYKSGYSHLKGSIVRFVFSCNNLISEQCLSHRTNIRNPKPVKIEVVGRAEPKH